jgi:hypothetical protein
MAHTKEKLPEGIALENRETVDQKTHPALALIAAEPGRFRRQGVVVAGWRTYRGRKLGPYYRLAFRRDARQCSVYLGRCRELADRVRAALKRLREPLRRARQIARMRAAVKASLRREKLRLEGQLRKFGLYLKGFETRGWRTADPAMAAAAACIRRRVGRELDLPPTVPRRYWGAVW